MSNLRFSKLAILNGLVASRVFSNSNLYPPLSLNGTGMFAKWSGGGFYSATGFNFALFKGTAPTQAELDAATGILASNFRASDVLIRYRTAPEDLKSKNELTSLQHNSWMYAPPVATAVAAGEATWFAFMNANCSQVLIGSVSAQGAGGEMQLITTTFVKDQMYAMPPWIVSIPRTVEI